MKHLSDYDYKAILELSKSDIPRISTYAHDFLTNPEHDDKDITAFEAGLIQLIANAELIETSYTAPLFNRSFTGTAYIGLTEAEIKTAWAAYDPDTFDGCVGQRLHFSNINLWLEYAEAVKQARLIIHRADMDTLTHMSEVFEQDIHDFLQDSLTVNPQHDLESSTECLQAIVALHKGEQELVERWLAA